MTYKHEYESEDTEKLIHSWFILSFCSLEQPSAREYQCVSTVCTLNGYEMSDTIDTNWSWLNIVIIIRNNKKGSFAWSKGKESLPSLPKLTQGVKEMFPRCDGRSGVVKCSLAISLGRPGEPRVIGRSSKVSLKERMLGKIIVPKIFEKRWTIDATNPNMSKSLTFQCVRSHEVIFNPNEGLCPKAILEWIQWIGLSLIQPHLLCASECLLLLPAQWRNNSLSLFCNVGFAHVCRSPPRRWRRPIIWTSAVLVARLRAVSQPVSRRLHLSTLARAGSLSTCAAVEQPDSVPEPRHCRSLESWQVCAWWTLPGFPAQSARERRTATCASPPNRQLGLAAVWNPREEGGESIPGTWTLPLGTCHGLVRASDDSRGAVGVPPVDWRQQKSTAVPADRLSKEQKQAVNSFPSAACLLWDLFQWKNGRQGRVSEWGKLVIVRMSHTTYSYTRDKLGFEPDREEPRLTHYAGVQTYQANGHSYSNGKTAHYADHQEQFGGVYEENLQTFKGEFLRTCLRKCRSETGGESMSKVLPEQG